jgi:hypothetical protein
VREAVWSETNPSGNRRSSNSLLDRDLALRATKLKAEPKKVRSCLPAMNTRTADYAHPYAASKPSDNSQLSSKRKPPKLVFPKYAGVDADEGRKR